LAESPWYGRLKGHVSDARSIQDRHTSEREAAEQRENSVILNKTDVQGDWDASRVLFTTLGGKVRYLTASDLAQFRRNMHIARDKLGSKVDGITAQQVINFAKLNPLGYLHPDHEGASNDLGKANKEITSAMAVSANGQTVRFITNASPGSEDKRHHVTVELRAFQDAVTRLATAETGDTKAIKKAARWLRDQKLAYECDCGRHRYYFRYVATIGGFSVGRQEWGYPKINNPELRGVACKHVLRVMAELRSSAVVLGFLERHLKKAQASPKNRAAIQLTEKEAAGQLEKASRRAREIDARDVDTNGQRVRKQSQKAAANKAARSAKRMDKDKQPKGTKNLNRSISRAAGGDATEYASVRSRLKSLGLTDADIQSVINDFKAGKS
jgi:hypothetical protein